MKKSLIGILLSLLFLAMGLYCSFIFTLTGLGAFILYPIWLFVGLFSLVFSLLQWRSWLEDRWARFSTALIISVIFTGITWLPAVQAYTVYRTNHVYEVAETFIGAVDQVGDTPEGFRLTGDVSNFLNDVSQSYELEMIEDMLGLYEFIIRFEQGDEYYMSLSEYSHGWRVYVRKNRNEK